MLYNEFQQIIPNVSRETWNNLKNYVDLLLNTNASLNLIAKSTEAEIWQRHIIDSIQLLDHIRSSDETIFDVGSGAGLPGIVLSIAGIKNVYLVESKQKKCHFLKEAAKLSPNKITVLNERVENVPPVKDAVFTCRAFAPLNKIFQLCQNHIKNAKFAIIPKGKNYLEEISLAKKEWIFNFSERKTITSSESKILIINSLDQCKK